MENNWFKELYGSLNNDDKSVNESTLKKMQQFINKGAYILKKRSELLRDKMNNIGEELINFEEDNESSNDFMNHEKYQSNSDLEIEKLISEELNNLLTYNSNDKKLKTIIETIKKQYFNIKNCYYNYKSLDEIDKEFINNKAETILKEQIKLLKYNIQLAIQYFNELIKEQKDCLVLMNDNIVGEVNKIVKAKRISETKNELACQLFENYIIRVDVTFNSLFSRMIENDIVEDQMYLVINNIIDLYKKVLDTYSLVNDEIRNRYYDRLNDKTQTLYTIINAFNELTNSSISINKDQISIDCEEKIDIRNTVIAISNKNIDIFKKYHYKESAPLYGRFNPLSYNEGDIYVGLTTKDVAINKKHVIISSVDVWADKGAGQIFNNRMYNSTTNDFKPFISYKQLREEMYKSKKQIIPYSEEGFASEYEIAEVLSYGYNTLGLNMKKQKTL